jgi:hypothetical protein
LITLSIKNEEFLHETARFLAEKNIRCHMFFEPDNNIGYSSITTEPLTKEQSKALSNYKLWRAK